MPAWRDRGLAPGCGFGFGFGLGLGLGVGSSDRSLASIEAKPRALRDRRVHRVAEADGELLDRLGGRVVEHRDGDRLRLLARRERE